MVRDYSVSVRDESGEVVSQFTAIAPEATARMLSCCSDYTFVVQARTTADMSMLSEAVKFTTRSEFDGMHA